MAAAEPKGPKQYQETMKKVSDYITEQWARSGQDIAGEKGFKAVHLEGVRASHPPLPIFLYMLAVCSLLSNGAKLSIWGALWPLSLWVLNCNYSQTRKSSLTGLADRLASVVDEHVRNIWTRVLHAKEEKLKQQAAAEKDDDEADAADEGGQDPEAGPDLFVKRRRRRRRSEPPVVIAGNGAGDGQPSASPVVWSAAYLGGTMERCKERCSGDFPQVRFPKMYQHLPGLSDAEGDAAGLSGLEKFLARPKGLPGKCFFSMLLAFDEVYDFLQELQLLDTPASSAAKRATADVGQTSGQSPNAGWANRLIQYGKSDHETKTCGAFGGAAVPSVNANVVGNLHPGVGVEMVRGLRGDHGCQTKARLIIVSGEPVQPHEEYDGFGVKAKSHFCPIPSILLPLLDMDVNLSSLQAAAAHFGKLDPEQASNADFSADGYYPDERGWMHTLPDGVVTRLRMKKIENGHESQWLLADRRIEIPAEYDIPEAAKKLLEHFGQTTHRKLEFTDEAWQLFQSYATYFQIRVKIAREEGKIDEAAHLGACPWKLAMFAATICLWDIMWQQHQQVIPDDGAKPVEIWEAVVHRAFGLLEILESIVGIMRGDSAGTSAFTATAPAQKAPGDSEELDREEKQRLNVARAPDTDFPEKIQHIGLKDTALARRLLFKATYDEASHMYTVKTKVIYAVITEKVMKDQKLSKPRILDARRLLSAFPANLGEFDADSDTLSFKIPEKDAVTEPEKAALRGFANCSMEELRFELEAIAQGKKRGAAGRAVSNAKKVKAEQPNDDKEEDA